MNKALSYKWPLNAGIFLFLASLCAYIYFDAAVFLLVPFAMLTCYAGWLRPTLVFFLLIISLPFSFEYHFENGLSTDVPDEALMLLLCFLVIASLVSGRAVISGAHLLHPVFILLLCWLLWTGVSTLLSTVPLLSAKFLLAKTWYVGAFVFPLLLWGNRENLRRMLILLCGFTLLAMGWVLMNHYRTGFSFATVNEAVRPFFRNHVNYSVMLVCMVPVLWWFYRGSRKGRIFLALLLALLLFALYVSYARGAWLALAAAIPAQWLIRRRMILPTYVAAILLVSISVSWLKKDESYLRFAPRFQTTIFHEDFAEHIVATYKLKDISTAERFHRWIAGFNMVAERPLGGFGPNSFYPAYLSFAVPAFKTWVSDNPERSGVHNYYLLLAIEQGLPGLILFLLLAGAMLYFCQRGFHQNKDPFYRQLSLVAGVITVMLLVLNFLSDLVETDKAGSLFFLCLGMSILVSSQGSNQLSDRARPHVQRIP